MAVAIGIWYGYREYNRQNPDLKKTKADYVVSITGILGEFESNDSLASGKYNGKTIEVTGKVRTVESQDQFYTVVMGDNEGLSSVRCSMDTVYAREAAGLTKGETIAIRGICTGYNRDEMGLGADLILTRCVIVSSK